MRNLFATVVAIMMATCGTQLADNVILDGADTALLNPDAVAAIADTQMAGGMLAVSNQVLALESGLASTTLGAEGIRKVGALGGYMIEEFFEDTSLRGLARDLPVFMPTNLPSFNRWLSWSHGDVYDPLNGYHHLDSGSNELTDNAVNYAYWSAADPTAVQWSTARPNIYTTVHLGTWVVAYGSILSGHAARPAGDLPIQIEKGQSEILPSVITDGLTVYGASTNLASVIKTSGTEYQDMSIRVQHRQAGNGTSVLYNVYFHTQVITNNSTNSVWDMTTTNQFPVGMWDNGTNLAPCSTSLWYRGLFVSMPGSTHLDYIAPDRSYTNEADAISGFDPDLPNGFTPYIPPVYGYVFSGADTSLRTESTYWLDRRLMIRRGISGGEIGGDLTVPTIQQVLQAGRGTGGLLMDGLGRPTEDDQVANKDYVDYNGNKASTGTAYVDPVNGDDVLGRVEKANLPFKSITAAINAAYTASTPSNRYSVLICIGDYYEDVAMQNNISLRGTDIEATVIHGTVTWGTNVTDITGSELQLVSVRQTNGPAIIVNTAADLAYMGIRSCALYSVYDQDLPMKSVVRFSRGNLEVFGTTWVELDLASDLSTNNAYLFYGTRDPANVGQYTVNDYSGSHVINCQDTNDTVGVCYADTPSSSFFATKSASTLILMDTLTNNQNKVKMLSNVNSGARTYANNVICDLRLSPVNAVDVILASGIGGLNNDGVFYNGSRVLVPNLSPSRSYYGSSSGTGTYVEVFNSQLGATSASYPQRYTVDGTNGTLAYVLNHASGDLLLGGGIDMSYGTATAPQSGHIRLFINPYAGLEQPYFIDSSSNKVRLGRDSVFNGYNMETTALHVGEAVYRYPATSPLLTPTVARAFGADLSRLPCAGIVVQTGGIQTGAVGRILELGRTETSFDTSAFTAGDKLYVSATVPGAITNVAPTGTNIAQLIGWVHTVGVNGLISTHLWEPDTLGGKTAAYYCSLDALTAETNRATVAENAISNSLYMADTNLGARITAETNRAIQAEAMLYPRSNPSNYVVVATMVAETNRAIVAENTISNVLSTVDTNLSARITAETNRATVAENTISNVLAIADTNILAQIPVRNAFKAGLLVDQNINNTTVRLAYSNLTYRVGRGIYSNQVAHWHPNTTNKLIELRGSIYFSSSSSTAIQYLYLYKNGTNYATLSGLRSGNNGSPWQCSWSFVDTVNTSTNDYYEIWATTTVNLTTTTGITNNWWYGEVE